MGGFIRGYYNERSMCDPFDVSRAESSVSTIRCTKGCLLMVEIGIKEILKTPLL